MVDGDVGTLTHSPWVQLQSMPDASSKFSGLVHTDSRTGPYFYAARPMIHTVLTPPAIARKSETNAPEVGDTSGSHGRKMQLTYPSCATQQDTSRCSILSVQGARDVGLTPPPPPPPTSHLPVHGFFREKTTGPAAVNIVGMVNSAPPTAPGGSGSALPGAVGVMDVNAPPTHAPLVGAPAIPGGSAATGYGAAAGVGAELLGQAYGTCVRSGQEDAARTRAGAVPVALPVTSMSTSFGGAPASAKGWAGAEGKVHAPHGFDRIGSTRMKN